MSRRGATMLAVLLGVLAGGVPAARAGVGWWHPAARPTWYWQLQGPLRIRPVQVTDLDGFGTSAATVARLHRLGQHVVCYVDVGSWERFRPDAGRFPRALLGRPNGWPGERWLDIARPAALEPIMRARFAMCARKGFDAVEPDNIDGYANPTGFAITAADQLRYDRWIARLAHGMGLAVLQKNDPDQARALEPSFDGALSEQCVQYAECGDFAAYRRAGKPVLDAEYRARLYPGLCAADARRGISGALYDLALDGRVWRPCDP